MTLPTNKASEMAELKACPFCGSEAIILAAWGDHHVNFRCGFCFVGGPPKSTKAEAITAWNTRAPPVTREAVLEEADVERVARAIDVHPWNHIDRWRAAAKCYRETPFEKAGFQDAADAEAMAADCERKANRMAEATFARARAAIRALSTPPAPIEPGIEREAVLEEAARVAESWNGGTADGNTFFIADAIRALKSTPPAPIAPGIEREDETESEREKWERSFKPGNDPTLSYCHGYEDGRDGKTPRGSSPEYEDGYYAAHCTLTNPTEPVVDEGEEGL